MNNRIRIEFSDCKRQQIASLQLKGFAKILQNPQQAAKKLHSQRRRRLKRLEQEVAIF